MGDPFKAIADNSRRSILEGLNEKDMTAGDIAKQFDISKPGISGHLKILQEADLVSNKKIGQHRIYSINKKTVQKMTKYFDKF
ncbi:MAG: metalloregulator ArsR/SmtB family transcription factor [Thermodesulfobacteriota bacterium]